MVGNLLPQYFFADAPPVIKHRILCNATIGTYVLKAICLQVVNFDMDGVKSSCAQSSCFSEHHLNYRVCNIYL